MKREVGNGFDTLYLTKGKKAIVDPEDYERCSRNLWSLSNRGCAVAKKNNTLVLLHRFIMNAPKGMFVDHINGDTLDNRKSNLRICTNTENQRNRTSATKKSKTGVLGVCWRKSHKKYRAQIKVNGKTIHLGYFDNLEEARQARIEAEKKYFGEYSPNYRK